MKPIRLSEAEYRDKVYACWLGKNIGGTLGAPWECRKFVNCLDFYSPVPDKSAPNDDLDLQLVWLSMLEQRGVDPTLQEFAEFWMKYPSAYPWNEYGFCHRNLKRGLLPPISGCFENYYVDEMGSPIRSEIWACVAPAEPELAASMSWKDSALDHAGGEGTYGEMFWAALESAAFVINDPMTLIRIGLTMIPLHSRISRVVREAVWCHENGVSWAEARERIVTQYGHFQPCHAPQNHGFTILGWLYGKDYGDKLCKAVNCGYDTDCTGATLGSVLGIIGGTAGIPEEWRGPVGETIVLHKFTRGLDAPKDINELTDRTMAVARQVVAERSDTVEFAEETTTPEDVLSVLHRNEKALAALQQDNLASVVVDRETEITLHYGGEPVLRPGIAKTVGVSVHRGGRRMPDDVKMVAPEGWKADTAPDLWHQKRFALLAEEVADRNQITVIVRTPAGDRSATFTVLGPGEAKGYPSGQNVPTCPTCHGVQGACLCVD